jgi:uncharacterized protein
VAATGADPTVAERPTVLTLDDVDEGLSELSFEIAAGDLELEDPHLTFPEPIAVVLKLARAMQTFNLGASLRWRVTGECCRCLSPSSLDLEGSLKVLLQRREATEEELEAFGEADEVEIVDPGTRKYDLAERIRDAVALELPMRTYCREDCKGLCPTCGQDLNTGSCECRDEAIDPRWEALAQLKTDRTDT